MTRHRMPPGDAAWLHMDRPTNRLVVCSVMWFDEPLQIDTLRELLQTRLVARFPRFAQRVIDSGSAVWWEDDEAFDLDRHLHRAELPAPGGRRELQRFISDRASRPLPPDRPLWEMTLVEGYRGGGCALVSRIHHCVADGVALARVMLSLTDDPEDARGAGLDDGDPQRRDRLSAAEQLVLDLTADAVHPTRVAHHVADLARATRELAHLVALPPDPHTCLRGELGTDKSVVWSEPFPLGPIVEAAHGLGVTVNDVAVSAVSGALRTHLAVHDGRVRDVRAILPVDLRDPLLPLPRELGNEFGLVFLDLPLSIDDPAERLAEIHRRAARLKHSPEPLVAFGILGLTGRSTTQIQQIFVDVFAAKGSAVVTNVVGPRRPVLLAGRKVRGTVSWPPESGCVGLGVSIISYDGELVIGLMGDDVVIADLDRLLLDTVTELGRVLALTPAP